MNNRYGFGLVRGLALAIVIGMAPPSWAAGYLGASFGKSDMDPSITEGLITSGTVDGKDSGFKFFGGVELNKNVALEFGYIDAGETTYSGSFFGSPVTGGTVEVSGFNFGVVGSFSVSPQFSLLGKIGFFTWEAEANDTTGGVPFSAKDDGTDLSFGFGAQYNFSKQVGMRAEWERFDANADIDFLSLGIVVGF